MSKIYVDGCSYTYGLNLDRKYSLGSLIKAQTNLARPGKSNVAMIEDLVDNIQDHDIFVIGFTFSSRYLFNCNGTDLDMHASNANIQLDTESHEQEYQQLHRLFYKFSSTQSFDRRSDFMVDAAIALLQQQNKTAVIFSWEPRKLINHSQVFYPRQLIPAEYNQSKTNWHLTAPGMELLGDIVKKKL